jgi:hypothetical protein
MGDKVKTIFVVIIIAGIILYVLTSGVLLKGFSALSSLMPNSTSSAGFSLFHFGSSTPFGPPNIFGPSPTPSVPPPSSPTITGSSANAIPPSEIPAGYTAAQLSPFFHQVHLAGVSAANAYYYGTITLSTYSLNASDTIDVTGWQIKSQRSGEYIPQAINYYDPSGLAVPSDIILKSGDAVYLYSSSAPFNLRLNECIGYVAHVANFMPALPANCPYVDRSQIESFTGVCQNYILSIGGCQAPNMASPQIPQTDYACQNYLENHFTYRSCVADHENDPNFLSNQVWVWMGNNVVDQYHDTVTLLDRNGLLVDIYSY